MGNFTPTLKGILKAEGYLANDPKDRGGLTWRGIAIAANPRWAGWPIVKTVIAANPKTYAMFMTKYTVGLNKENRAATDVLNNAIIKFGGQKLVDMETALYKSNYWNVNSLDLVEDQQLSETVADMGVNAGVGTAAEMLQQAYNYLDLGNTLSEDGAIGSKTLQAVNSADPKKLHTQYNALRKAYYLDIIRRKPDQVKYKNSWMSRLKPYKT